MEDFMTEIRELSFSYKKKEPLFSSLSLTLDHGSIYGLLGKNGAGKTPCCVSSAACSSPKRVPVPWVVGRLNGDCRRCWRRSTFCPRSSVSLR